MTELLRADLLRVSPGRPEALLAHITIAARSPRRQHRPGHDRLDGHVVTGIGQDGDERIETHVYIDRWPAGRPAIDLLATVLRLAQAERIMGDAGIDTIMMPASFAETLVFAYDYAKDRGFTASPEDVTYMEQLRLDLAGRVAA